MKIAVVGTGYVGLVTGTCFAETGNHVTCIDIDQAKVNTLRKGDITIYEPGLEKLFSRNLRDGRLTFTTELAEGVAGAEVIFLALPTPPKENGAADLRHVMDVAEKLGPLLSAYTVVVNKSTVPVGTADKVREAIGKAYKGDFDVVSNPEFLQEGVAVEGFMKPDRIIIGCSSEKGKKIMGDLYAPFVRQGNPVIYMDERSAELTKYASNSFLATKISFMNEIARLCELFDADVDMVRRGIGSDGRIGRRFLFSGIGYGGSCFPKDVRALVNSAKESGYDFRILRSVVEVNEAQRLHLLPAMQAFFEGSLKGKKIALWGLAFKPNTDDIREAPALQLIREMVAQQADVTVFDPEAMKNTKEELGDIVRYAENQYDAIKGADALVIATEWNEFRTPDFTKMGSLMKSKTIFDGRNVFELPVMKAHGFYYHSIGRKTVKNNHAG